MSSLFPLILAVLASGPPLPVVRSPDDLVARSRPSALAGDLKPSETPPVVTVVHFWATWCGTCTKELPEIQRLEAEVAALGQRMLFVSLDQPDQARKVAAFMAKQQLCPAPGASALLLEAPDSEAITSRFDARWRAQLPATFLLLESGPPVASHFGKTPVDAVLGEVSAQVERLKSVNSRPAGARTSPATTGDVPPPPK